MKVTAWLGRELVRLLRYRIADVAIRGFLSIGLKIAAAAILYSFINALADEKTSEIKLLSFTFDLTQFFVYGMVIGTILMMSATFLTFSIRRLAASGATLFEERCVKRMLDFGANLPHPKVRVDGQFVEKKDMVLLFNRVRSCNFLARNAIQLAPAFIGFCCSLLFLIYLDPSMTVGIALAFILVLILRYPLTNRSAKASVALPKGRQAAAIDFNAFIKRSDQLEHKPERGDDLFEDLFAAGGSYKKDLKTFSKTIENALHADMLTRMGNHAIFAGLLIYIGYGVLSGNKTWAGVATYVAVARFNMKDIQLASSLLSNIGRLFHSVESFMVFVKNVEQADELEVPVYPHKLALKTPKGEDCATFLEAGKVVYVSTQAQPLAQAISLAYVETTGYSSPICPDEDIIDPKLSLRRNLLISDEWVEEDLIARLRKLGLREEDVSALPKDFLDLCPPPALKGVVILLSKLALMSKDFKRAIAVPSSSWAKFDATTKKAISDHIPRCPILVVGAKSGSFAGMDPQTPVIVEDRGKLSFLVPYESLDKLVGELQKQAPKKSQASEDLLIDIGMS